MLHETARLSVLAQGLPSTKNIFPCFWALCKFCFTLKVSLEGLLWWLSGKESTCPPANAGDMGSTPGPGRSHIAWSNLACVPQLLSLCPRAQVLQLLKSVPKSPCSLTREATAINLRTIAKTSPCSQQLEKNLQQ